MVAQKKSLYSKWHNAVAEYLQLVNGPGPGLVQIEAKALTNKFGY